MVLSFPSEGPVLIHPWHHTLETINFNWEECFLDQPTEEIRQRSLEALGSAISKTEQALGSMQEKGAGTTLVEKRLAALKAGLCCLNRQWYGTPCEIQAAVLKTSLLSLRDILTAVDKELGKARAGSPQKTLLQRRSMALTASLQAVETCLAETSDPLPL